MKSVNILDCTLRDGGYINDFKFGEFAIRSIIKKLSDAQIDVIECGFLRSDEFDSNKTLFGSVEAIQKFIEPKNPDCMYVAMIQYGKISIEEISPCDGKSIDGIRLTFHEYEVEPSLILGKQLMDLGYKVFMQAVGTTAYTDSELLALIEKINSLKPFGFYMVDTLGLMYKKDLLRMFYLVDNNLSKDIILGFHSHNNLQMSFANAQELLQTNTARKIIVDASVFGMGRGAGNLNTELLVRFMNVNLDKNYDEVKIMEILDEYIAPLKQQYSWGYAAAYYIAAITGCHPNYANFLLNRQTLHVQDIYAILNNLDAARRHLFDKSYIEKKYSQYMNHLIDDSKVTAEIAERIKNKKLLLIAPGKSLRNDEISISNYIAAYNPAVISINFIPELIDVDFVFVSNMKRFSNLEFLISQTNDFKKIIMTSNIPAAKSENVLRINYSSYTNNKPAISDNAGLMCIEFFIKAGASDIMLAGFDGFLPNFRENYFDDSMVLSVDEERLQEMNEAMKEKISQLQKRIKLGFFRTSLYQSNTEN